MQGIPFERIKLSTTTGVTESSSNVYESFSCNPNINKKQNTA